MEYFSEVYFIYDEGSKTLVEEIESNAFGVKIISLEIEYFIENVLSLAQDIKHIVVSSEQENISRFLAIAYKHKLSIGIVPPLSQTEQIKNIHASDDIQENIEIALRDDCKSIDLLEVNGTLVSSQGLIGTIPLVGKTLSNVRHSFFKTFIYSIKKFFSIKLQKFEITTHKGQKITTAGSAVVILNHTNSGFISKIFNFNESMCNSQVTILIISPYSIFEYIKLLSSIFRTSKKKENLPKSIGYVQSESFSIKASSSKQMHFDNAKSLELPIECKVVPEAIKINASDAFWLKNKRSTSDKEIIKIANLPDKDESLKYMSHHIPLFNFASEERFKELFQVLRTDSKLNVTYLILMLLSTLLAAFGLFSNSAAVIIGAMLVAPLMLPIVSISMGLLRGDSQMISDSLVKIGVGVFVALLASSALSFLLPNFEITQEMKARINPTLLDLGIAIISGIAAAYSKSFKEIIQNLAGVAIAVALVPPLAVSGIGLGYGDIHIFLGAFLLFFTNLIGIIIAAVITFQLLGFSNVVKSKKSVIFILVLLLAVSFPLYASYDDMIEKYKVSNKLKKHRFLVHQKYIIVHKANLMFHGEKKILNLKLVVRESLTREDFRVLKQHIQRLLNTKLFIRTEVEYIL